MRNKFIINVMCVKSTENSKLFCCASDFFSSDFWYFTYFRILSSSRPMLLEQYPLYHK